MLFEPQSPLKSSEERKVTESARHFIPNNWNYAISGMWRRSAASRSLGLRVWTPSGAWISVSCKCCVLSGIEVYASDWSLFQRSSTECGASENNREASKPWPTGSCWAMEGKLWHVLYIFPFHQNLSSAANSENRKLLVALIFSVCWHANLFCQHSSIVDNKRISKSTNQY
jgi:hypothetical protein